MDNIPENLNLILLNIGFSELNANWNWKSVYSPFARIYYIKGGEARTRINNKVYTLKPDHLYLTPPFTLHDDECDSLFSLYYIHFYEKNINTESIFDRYNFPVEIQADNLDLLLTERLLRINPGRHLQHVDPELYDNMPTFSQYLAENKRTPFHTIIETQGILHQFISKFLERATVKSEFKDARIKKCLQYIHENIDKDISVSQLADLSCITEDHLIRIFKKEVKSTPLKYINNKKMEKAQLLLLTTNLPVREVALELSIDNISYFNRIFKQYTGKTPKEYKVYQ
ncbi:AraC family transcriptional regulator [Bacteroides sp. 519]|uniref:helix-turn-helix transcriptional regulator n=1 Tax=Bacteroides sp. 519 TaxID=2302937 RepID=UPI0013D76CB4|nr:AraC family transcriptional regulator [Bacteroides sp. 519]NDV58053.1 AraC family transcriptional regulator [Bacteroides sp. 519]